MTNVPETTRNSTQHPATLGSLRRIFRTEFVPALVPFVAVAFFYSARDLSDLFSLPVLEAMVIMVLLMISGMGVNSLCDQEVDRRIPGVKRQSAEAIDRVGRPLVVAVIIAQFSVSLALAVHISLQFDNWLPVYLVLVGSLFGYGYSVPPLRFKTGAIPLNAASLLFVILGPILLSTFTFQGTIPPANALFVFGIAVVIYGTEFVNQVMDHPDDKAVGLRTTAVRLGVRRSLDVALVVPVLGLAISGIGLYLMLQDRWPPPGTVQPWPPIGAVWTVLFAIILLGCALPMVRTVQIRRICHASSTPDCVACTRRLCHFHVWHGVIFGGVALSGVAFYLVTNHLWVW